MKKKKEFIQEIFKEFNKKKLWKVVLLEMDTQEVFGKFLIIYV